MLSILFITTAIFVVVMGKLRTGNLYNPLTFYIIFWCFWTVVSLSDPFLLFNVSTKTYMMVWLNVIMFSFGFLVVSKKNKPANIKVSGFEFTKTSAFLILQIIVFFVLIYYSQKYNSVLSNLEVNDIRRIVFEQGLLFKSAAEITFYTWIISPLVYGSIVLLISNFVFNDQKSIAFFVALANGFLFSQIGYGRLIFFNILIYFLVSIGFKYDLYNNLGFESKPKNKKQGVLYIILIGIAINIMNLSSAKRIGVSSLTLTDSFDVFVNNSLKDLVVYFTGPFRALDFFLTSNITENTGYTLGRAFFSGIEEIIDTFLILVSNKMSSIHTANEITSSFTVHNIYIGNNTFFNAFYTNIMNFYLDGGLTFVILLSCIYGVVSGLLYNYYLRNTNLFTLSLIVYLTYNMIASEFRWSYSAPSTWILISVLVICNHLYNKRLTASSSSFLIEGMPIHR